MVDLLSVLPLEVFALAASSLDMTTVAAYLRLNRILRCYVVTLLYCKRTYLHSSLYSNIFLSELSQ